MPELSPHDLIEIGRVGKPHGVRGGFYVDGAIDAAALVAGFELLVGEQQHVVAGRAGTDARPIVTLTGVNDRDVAAKLRGLPLAAPRESLTPLGEGEWYARDLVGLKVVDLSGRELGVVERLTNAPSVDLLEVADASGEMLLLPMIGDAISRIDVAAGVVEIDAEFLDLG